MAQKGEACGPAAYFCREDGVLLSADESDARALLLDELQEHRGCETAHDERRARE